MSERTTFDRRQLLTAGVAGLVGGAVGVFAGRQRGETPAVHAAEPVPGARQRSAAGPLTSYAWTLTVQGGYGWWFKKTGGKTSVSLMALDRNKCRCPGGCVAHPMLLITSANRVKTGAGTTYNPSTAGKVLYWTLEGPTRFIKGMPANGITERAGTKWEDLTDPYAPDDPHESSLWNDQVWLPEREKAKSTAASNASAEFLLTDGDLSVEAPWNQQARLGRWEFKQGQNTRTKALSDVVRLSGQSQDVIGIETKGGRIFLEPTTNQLPLSIRGSVRVEHIPLQDGDPLHHFARLYDFVDQKECKDAIVPVFRKRPDVEFEPEPKAPKVHRAPSKTPGDLCPPLFMI